MRTQAAVTCIGALGLASWAAGAVPELTLAVRLFERPGYVPTHVFSGRLENGAAGELVTVLAKVCPRSFETSVAGGSTFTGGFFELSASGPRTAVTYRARWEGRFSEPVKFWPPLPVETERARPTSLTVRIDTSEALQNLNGKLVELQRRDAGSSRWRPYRRARLKRDRSEGSFPFRFAATFTKIGARATVRVRIPRQTAAPCFQPLTTPSIRP